MLTNGLSRFYTLANSKPYETYENMQTPSSASNMQTIYSLSLHFLGKEPRTDGTDEDYQVDMEIMKNECQNIINILQNYQDAMTDGTIDDLHPTSSWSCRRRITIPGLDASPDRRLAY
jgi:hypothetical protein